MHIGFIGVGIMGLPMAQHLQSAGHEIFLLPHRSPLPATLLENGAVACTSAADVADRSEIVVLMLPDTPDVEQVLFSEKGVAAALSPGKLIIDMSSISPLATRKFAKRVRSTGCDYIDAPVSGGQLGAQSASLTIMAGGERESFERALPLFALMGKNITHVGPVGAGQTTKVANQIIVALTIGAVAEGLVFASKAGADPAKVREALMGGFAASRILQVHGERMIERDFAPGFRIDLHRKDLDLALQGARTLGMALPGTAIIQQMLGACAAAGEGSLDHSALVRTIERLAGHELV